MRMLFFILIFLSKAAFADYVIPYIDGKTFGHESGGSGYIYIDSFGGANPPMPGERLVVRDGNYEMEAEITGIGWGSQNSPGTRLYFKNARLKEKINFDEKEGLEVRPSEAGTPGQDSPQVISSTRFFTADDFLKAGQGALTKGVAAGLSVLLYQGLIYDSDTRKAYDQFNEKKRQFGIDVERLQGEINSEILEGFTEFQKFIFQADLLRAHLTINQDAFDFSKIGRQYKFQSTDPQFIGDLRDIGNAVDSIPKYDARSLNLKQAAHEFIGLADQSFAAGDMDDAFAYRKYALATADLLFGIDPVTGTFRSVYEAFTGKNFVTGETLSTFERGFAVVGMVSFGYGSKVGQGLKGFGKIAGKVFNKQNLDSAMDFAKATFGKVKDTTLYVGNRLWNVEKLLQKSDPNLLKQIHTKPNSTDYLNHIHKRSGQVIQDPYNSAAKISQEMSIEALDVVDRVEKTRLVARQGEFPITEAQRKALQAADLPDVELERLARGSNIIATSPVDKQSVFFGELASDLGTPSFAHRHGGYSNGVDFVEIVEIEKGASFLTRKAPDGFRVDAATGKISKTHATAIEVLVPQGKATTKEFWILLDKNKTIKIKVEP